MKTGKGFKEEYSFLSNFTYFEKPLIGEGLSFPSNEHFYVAMKTKDKSIRHQVAEHPSKGLKKFGNSFPLRDDWEDIKLSVMEYGLRWKFSKNNPNLRKKLIATEGVDLIEYNYWRDVFWGVSLQSGEGENHLGKLLMKIREEIIEEEKI